MEQEPFQVVTRLWHSKDKIAVDQQKNTPGSGREARDLSSVHAMKFLDPVAAILRWVNLHGTSKNHDNKNQQTMGCVAWVYNLFLYGLLAEIGFYIFGGLFKEILKNI